MLLVEPCGSMSLERGAHTVLQGRIHQQTHRHDHEKGHHAFRLFEGERRGDKLGGLQKTDPTLGMPLACVAGAECRWGHQRRVACMRREAATTLLVHQG